MKHLAMGGASIRYLLFAGYAWIWTTLLLVPDPGRFLGFRVDVSEQTEGASWPLDKVVHAAGYFGFTVLMLIALGIAPLSLPWPWLLLAAAAHGALTEWIQQFVPHRDSDLGDWLEDVVGILVGTVVVGACRWWYRGPADSLGES